MTGRRVEYLFPARTQDPSGPQQEPLLELSVSLTVKRFAKA